MTDRLRREGKNYYFAQLSGPGPSKKGDIGFWATTHAKAAEQYAYQLNQKMKNKLMVQKQSIIVFVQRFGDAEGEHWIVDCGIRDGDDYLCVAATEFFA